MNRFGRQRNQGLDTTCPINWQHPLNRGLVGCWMVPPNPGWRGGLVLRDLVRGGKKPNDGTLTNFANPNTVTSGWAGYNGRLGGYGSLVFDGVNDYVVTSPISIVSTTNLSFSFWWKTPVLTGNFPAMITTTGSGNGITVYFDTVGATLNFTRSNGGTAATWSYGASLSGWHHYCMTDDRTTGTLYFDGVAKATRSLMSSSSSSVGLEFGRLDATRLTSGPADDFRLVLGRAYSAAEVFQIYDQSRRGHPDTMRWLSPRTFFGPTVVSTGKFQPSWAYQSNIILGGTNSI